MGEHVEALVLQKEDKEGRLILSKKRAQYERAWGTIEKIKESEGVVKGPVIEVVKGGLIVDIGLRGFLPASLVELRRVRELQPYVGRNIEAKIIELDRNRNNVVLSRRAWLEETQREQRGDFLANLKPGERRRGVVSSVVNFGAFVDLGGMDGLIHVSELSWKHVDHPSSVGRRVGDEVEVEVLDVDLSKERISLSLKATQTDPWQDFANTHQVGELVYGRITKLVPFGAFVQVGDGIEGLVHISEMAVHHVDLPEQVVTTGEELWVKIIDIDLQRRRISLSIKQAAEGGEVSEEYREAFGEHAYDEQGNYIGFDYGDAEFTPETEAQAAWADLVEHSAGRSRARPTADAPGTEPAALQRSVPVLNRKVPRSPKIAPARSPSRMQTVRTLIPAAGAQPEARSPAESPSLTQTLDLLSSRDRRWGCSTRSAPSSQGEVRASARRHAGVWPLRARRSPSSTATPSQPTRSPSEIGGSRFVCDVSDHEQVRHASRRPPASLVGCRSLSPTPGSALSAAVDEMEPDEWRKVIDVNLSGVFHTVRECLPHLVASRNGTVVCTASISGVRPAEGEAAYAAAKAGVAAFCASVALEYGPVVRCNAVSPGMIATALTAPLHRRLSRHRRTDGAKDSRGRIGTPDDIADVVVFLCSDLARFVTGQNIVVDGGMTLHGSGVDGLFRYFKPGGPLQDL